MFSVKKISRNSSLLLLCFFVSLFLFGCGSSGVGGNSFSEKILGYDLSYNGKIQLENIGLRSDDLDEIVELYQEVGDNVGYRDSLLVAQKHSQGFGANAFAQDNIDMLQEQGLELSNIQKSQIWLEKNGKKINGVLVEYEITQGLLNDIPLLYVSQLFIPKGDTMILMSFITENHSSHSSAVDMFKNVR